MRSDLEAQQALQRRWIEASEVAFLRRGEAATEEDIDTAYGELLALDEPFKQLDLFDGAAA